MGYLVCLMIGALIGYFVCALMAMAKESEDEE